MENDLPTRLERLHAVLYSRPESVLTEAAAILRSLPPGQPSQPAENAALQLQSERIRQETIEACAKVCANYTWSDSAAAAIRSLPSQSQPDPLQLLADEAQELDMGYGGQPQGNVPEWKVEALRQYRHNDNSGFVFAYDKDVIDRHFASIGSAPAPQQEAPPVAWMTLDCIHLKPSSVYLDYSEVAEMRPEHVVPLYTSLAAPAIPTWINVEERLPEMGQEVLVYRPFAHETHDPHFAIDSLGHYEHPSPQGITHRFRRWCHPSHWMPLPASPAAPIPADPKEEE